jgi:hypothetical protein
MAERAQMTGAVLDGPLTFENAISRAAATTKPLDVLVADGADMLIVSDFEAGNRLARALSFRAPHGSVAITRAPAWPVARLRHTTPMPGASAATDIGTPAGSKRCARILVANAGSSHRTISVFATAADRPISPGPTRRGRSHRRFGTG